MIKMFTALVARLTPPVTAHARRGLAMRPTMRGRTGLSLASEELLRRDSHPLATKPFPLRTFNRLYADYFSLSDSARSSFETSRKKFASISKMGFR